jgi:hypothetical protein
LFRIDLAQVSPEPPTTSKAEVDAFVGLVVGLVPGVIIAVAERKLRELDRS